ncbi:hypothetical protein EP7_003444 [Isosphaeraceae bacterium EP7]
MTQTPSQPESKPEIKASEHAEGIQIDATGEDSVDAALASLEMAGEEAAAGWKPASHPTLSPEVRYLHVSRTIHQLITDRNRTVGIFLLVASISFGASTALLNVKADVVPIVPLKTIQFWCLPLTLGTLAVIGAFMALILIRTRIGLIYEAAKMNALLGLPNVRVKRVNPLSIFFLMHALVVVLGGASAGLTAMMLWMLRRPAASFQPIPHGPSLPIAPGNPGVSGSELAVGCLVGLAYLGLFMASYYVTILKATTDTKLDAARA